MQPNEQEASKTVWSGIAAEPVRMSAGNNSFLALVFPALQESQIVFGNSYILAFPAAFRVAMHVALFTVDDSSARTLPAAFLL